MVAGVRAVVGATRVVVTSLPAAFLFCWEEAKLGCPPGTALIFGTVRELLHPTTGYPGLGASILSTLAGNLGCGGFVDLGTEFLGCELHGLHGHA